MKKFELGKADDLTIEPCEELNRKTLHAMRSAAENKKSAGSYGFSFRNRGKLVVNCAVIAVMALFLMSMGCRVFEYLAYVPGMGIVTEDQEDVYTLEQVVQGEERNGRIDYIEAMSMIPDTTGRHEGEWMVTVMTTEKSGRSFSGEGTVMPDPIVLVTPDGDEVVLEFDGGNRLGTSYKGYTDCAVSGDYTLRWNGAEYSAAMKKLENSVYANCQYPISNGLTVIAFPVADGSDRLIFDIVIDAEDENWLYWAERSGSILVEPFGVTVTDTLGNVYEDAEPKWRHMRIPESERDVGVNDYIDYKTETYLVLDRRLEAPVASVDIEGIRIALENMDDEIKYTVTIPEYGETVMAETLPNGGVFMDTHGIKASFESIDGGFNEQLGGYEMLVMAEELDVDFVPDAADAYISLRYINSDRADTAAANEWQGSASDIADADGKLRTAHHCLIEGLGDVDPYTEPLNISFGEEVTIKLEMLFLMINGNWSIDFTHPAE